MNKITIFEYDRKYRAKIQEEFEKKKCVYATMSFGNDIQINLDNLPNDTEKIVIDISHFFRDEYIASLNALAIEKLIDKIVGKFSIFLIIDKRYCQMFQDVLYHKIKKIIDLAEMFEIKSISKNIIDIEETEFQEIIKFVNDNLIGHEKFKLGLEKELKKYRLFNKLGYYPIFSVFICGKSGIGKTEVARILHRKLSPEESFIKINFGNYSDQNALSSLIGSPRGYIGSSKGELTDKLENSNSRIILIDEFEKSNQAVQNFFLQLLEDGVFTDSLGREYDLNKYIIIFTSNLTRENVGKKIAPELISRFSFKYSLSELTNEDKKFYVEKRTDKIVSDLKENLKIDLTNEEVEYIKNINEENINYNNMRNVNSELMNRICDMVYPKM